MRKYVHRYIRTCIRDPCTAQEPLNTLRLRSFAPSKYEVLSQQRVTHPHQRATFLVTIVCHWQQTWSWPYNFSMFDHESPKICIKIWKTIQSACKRSHICVSFCMSIEGLPVKCKLGVEIEYTPPVSKTGVCFCCDFNLGYISRKRDILFFQIWSGCGLKKRKKLLVNVEVTLWRYKRK